MAIIRMRDDMRRPCILLCSFVVILIICYNYTRQSQSGTAARKNVWSSKSKVKTTADQLLGIRNYLPKNTLTGNEHETNIINGFTGGDISLGARHTGSAIKPSLTNNTIDIMHRADERTTQDLDERFDNVTASNVTNYFRTNNQTMLSLTKSNAKIHRTKKISEVELQKLLKSELDAAHNTIAFERDVTSRFKSVGKTILIIGYHRTGSTLLGETFKVHPGTFYLFEPLRILRFAKNLTFINGTRIPNLPVHYPIAEKRILDSLLTCNLHQLPLELLMGDNHVGRKDSLEHTVYCLQRYMSNFVMGTENLVNGKHVNNDNSVINAFSEQIPVMRNANTIINELTSRCLQPAVYSCLKAHVRVYKFIHLRMPGIVNILRDTSDVSFIHLIRDPRATIRSQSHLMIQNKFKREQPYFLDKPFSVKRTIYFKEFISIANKYCSEVRSDKAAVGNYLRQYSNRILTVLYERFAVAPLTMAKWLYTFAGLPFQGYPEGFIRNLTLGRHNYNCSYCAERGNMTYSAFRWRERIHSTQLRIIDELCRDLYPVMGLRELRHLTDVRNMSVPILV